MEVTISKSQFKPAALEYFRKVQEDGLVIVITDRGEPVARIVPFRSTHTSEEAILALLRGSLLRYDDPALPVGEGDWEALK